ncbi:glutamyl-tRNA reductase [Chitinophagaceae bacterium MMS25-I14]
MNTKDRKHISGFWIVGINYKKTDASIRGQFAINDEQYDRILDIAPNYGLGEFFILSTCNRTEIYGFADSADQMIDLICSETEGEKSTFSALAYIKNGMDAIWHLFQVSAGLDSQILGDYEIIGQIKQSAKFAKKKGFIGAFTERLLNSVLQSSKAIKTHTQLSGGTVSVAFAAVQYVKEHVKNIKDKEILLLGTGKIGRNTCRNIVDYLHTRHVTLINRTHAKAAALALELHLKHAPLEELPEYLAKADIIFVATNANEPTILKHHLEGKGEKIIIDLSIPYNVADDAQQLENVTLVNVDELSRIKDETLQKRIAEVPKANAIIEEHINEFVEWHGTRKYASVLKVVKHTLHELHYHSSFMKQPVMAGFADEEAEEPHEKIQKVINTLAVKVRSKNDIGCQCIQAINEFIA